MVQILPERESFGAAFGRTLGGAFKSTAEGWAQKKAKEAELKRFKDLLGIQEQTNPGDQLFSQNMDIGSVAQEKLNKLPPEERDQILQELNVMPKEQQQQQQADPFKKTKAAIAARMPKEVIDLFKSQEELALKEAQLPKQEYIKSEYKSLPKFMEGIEATEDKLPINDMAIKIAEEAIEDPSKWAAFRDLLADKSGYEGFRSARGAELTSAIKQYFLGDLASIKGGRPNQLIEQQLLDAYPKIGRDPIANQKILQGMKLSNELASEKVRLARDLEEKYLAKQGFLPPGFQSIVKKQLRPIADKLEKDTIKRLTSLSKFQKEYEKMATKQLKSGEVLMLSPDGDYEAIDKKRMQEAKDQGYIKLK
jgi:hypothetical protein